MGVGEKNSIDVARLEPERQAVSDGLVRAALEHPAVDEDARTSGVEKEL